MMQAPNHVRSDAHYKSQGLRDKKGCLTKFSLKFRFASKFRSEFVSQWIRFWIAMHWNRQKRSTKENFSSCFSADATTVRKPIRGGLLEERMHVWKAGFGSRSSAGPLGFCTRILQQAFCYVKPSTETSCTAPKFSRTLGRRGEPGPSFAKIGPSSRWRTPISGYLWFLRKSSVFCAFLRPPSAWISRTRGESANCNFLRTSARSVTSGPSPQAFAEKEGGGSYLCCAFPIVKRSLGHWQQIRNILAGFGRWTAKLRSPPPAPPPPHRVWGRLLAIFS